MPSQHTSLAALLDPLPVPSPSVVTPSHVGGGAAWADLLRTGILNELYDGVGVAAHTLVKPQHRALALAGEVPGRSVLAAASAAWVHTGMYGGTSVSAWPFSAPIELAYSSGTRPPVPHPCRVVRRAQGLTRDTMYIAQVPVTRIARTAIDVARTAPLASAVPVLVALSHCGMDLGDAERLLDRRARVVGRPAAHRAFAAARMRLAG